MEETPINLMEFSRGAGCGCKIAPQVLTQILSSGVTLPHDKLLVGNDSNDDAAVYDLDGKQALISTTDFFTPIVDDAFQFGAIAAANALSDVYAMGGRPIFALAVLGWPIEKLSPALAGEVLNGAKSILEKIGIPLAGGHSIDSAEPFFGLSVNGLTEIENLKRNDTAKEGDFLFLTKPLGVGILSASLKRKLITEADKISLLEYLTKLNDMGEKLGKISSISAMTDVTGFGLAGHLIEMAKGSGLSAEINYSRIKLLNGTKDYLSKRIIPDATYRNWNSYQKEISFEEGVDVMEAFSILPDPQTNGGLLIAVNPDGVKEVKEILKAHQLEIFAEPIGVLTEKKEHLIVVKK
ncbi:selenide, water dikinase SelD [Paracoccus sp. (in: a-proteobacteria)]|uniref:selenide, water dikinase SelD n=1 Tax=Paracoccus sp. TaxID=267 RepID=UPI002AFF5746|nr:selenide, water dikinase SelD [Paracoccus sp. (in: a-proteobacteria)]